ncbi:Xenobiotic-transporting ATPase [Syntrophobacter sp. SbD2]|nr:Xenobiotic-transporting ATPase [Syntrophobacter sp. SbD2]
MLQGITRIRDRLRYALNMRRAMRLVWRSSPGYTLSSIGLIIVQGILPLASLYLMKLIVDGVAAGITSPVGISESFRKIIILIVFSCLVALLAALCQSISEIMRETQGEIVTDHVSDMIHKKSVEIDLAYYDYPVFHDTLHLAQHEAPYRPTRIVKSATQLCQSSISLIAVGALLIHLNWMIAVALFVALIPGFIARLNFADRMHEWQLRRTKMERKSSYYHWMMIDGVPAKEMRLFGLGPLFINGYRLLRAQLRKEKLSISTRRTLFELITNSCGLLTLFGVFAFFTYETVSGRMTLGDMVMYYQAFQRAQGYLQEFLTHLSGLYEDNLFLSRFYEFIDLKPMIVAPAVPSEFPKPLREGILLNNVCFQYPTHHKPVLKNIDLKIAPGQVVALVGENGSGKTTLVKLLCRLYDPTNGSITVDGINLKQFDLQALRKNFSVIFQDYIHYDVTARENIWFGNIELDPHDERVARAAEHTGAAQAIQKLSKGYATPLGLRFDEGEELSIGEWQKVALARAFLRDAQFVILDEPTSSLDVRSEYEVFNSFHRLLHGKMGIIISHRFSTVRMADYIYVMSEGEISERGTHEGLVRQGGIYAGLFEMQAQNYVYAPTR